MDIWAWLWRATADLRAAGHHDLANKFANFADTVGEHDHDTIDAQYPELLAAARALGNGWLEVYLRHWYAQSLYHRNRSADLLKEAVVTLEFAHREDTAECPQSVCAVQDLCMAYASCDGPAYVEQRLAVTAEAFARIDASWPCYVCLSAEEANAYVDAGRLDDALVTVRRRAGDVITADGRLDGHDATVFAQWIAAAGDPAGALEMLAPAAGRNDEPFAAEQGIIRAQARLALGDAEAAARELPTAEASRREDEYWRWIFAHEALVAAGVRANTWEDGAAIQSFVAELVQHGASWRAFRLAESAARLAVRRGARCTADAALALMRAAQAQLTDPARVAALVDDATTSVAAIPAPVLPCHPAEAAQALDAIDDLDPERLLDLADVAVAQGAHGEDIVVLRARLMGQLGRLPEARAAVLTRLERAPESPELTAACFRAFWLDVPTLQRVAEIIAVAQPLPSAWALANAASSRGDHAEVMRHCRTILDADPTAVNTLRLLADSCRATGDYVEELAARQAVIEHGHPVEDIDRWQLLVPATIYGEWAIVREQLPYLDLRPQSSDGPIAEHWGYVMITYPDGRSADVVAQRTGPVSATIRSILAWDDDQQYGDEVVFAPGYLNERPVDADAPDSTWRPLFAHVVTVREARYRSQPVGGPYPGDDAWEAVRARVAPCELVRQDAFFEVFDQVRGCKVPAVFAQLLIPPNLTDAEADALLTAATADLVDPLYWWELADEAGGDTRMHAERGKRYGRTFPGA